MSTDTPPVETGIVEAPTQESVTENITPIPEDYGAFPPGTIVLAKLKSFPPWPAIVIPFDLIPEPILKSKPKKPINSSSSTTPRSGSRSKRKSTAKKTQDVDNRLWCVRFLKDDNFMWATIKDISPLSTEQIESALNSKKSKTIKLAYEMALNPPDLDEFIIYGSDGKPTAVDNEAGDEDFVDDEDMIDGDDYEEDEEEQDLEDEEESEEEEELVQETKKRRRKSQARKPVKSQAAKRQATKGRGRKKIDEYEEEDAVAGEYEEEDEEVDTSGDEDWENDHNEDEPVAIDTPSSKEIVEDLKKKTPVIKKARLQFQNTLLTPSEPIIDSKESKNLIGILDVLDSFDNLPLSLLKHYSLNKVLIDALKKPELENKDLKKLKNRIAEFVKNRFDIDVEIDERWGFGYQKPKEVNGNNEAKEVAQTPSREVNDTDPNEAIKEESS